MIVSRGSTLSCGIPDHDKSRCISSIIFFLPKNLSAVNQELLNEYVQLASQQEECKVCLVSSFSSHFSDNNQQKLESFFKDRFLSIKSCRVVILRTSHISNVDGKLENRLKKLAPFHPLVSSAWKSCFLDVEELLETIEKLCHKGSWPKERTITLLGSNRLLKEFLAEKFQPGIISNSLKGLANLLRLFLVGWAVGILFLLVSHFKKPWKLWQFDTIEPTTISELLALYNPYNYQHIAIAGYNTGVVHFGWKYPGKTIVKTISSAQRLHIHDNLITVDAGTTLKQAITALNDENKEFYVTPNYSYISAGTTFFVPIHGSGSEVSTLGDTIERALLYDPVEDRLIRVKRGDLKFEHYMYNGQIFVLVLRLQFRVRESSQYFVHKESCDKPSARDVWQIFDDPSTSNIEIRKSSASDDSIQVSKYYVTNDEAKSLLEVPRDSIGRLWDRLEENPITSYLFHALVRILGFHVELFLTREQFKVFWDAHYQLPLSKIQLRYVRADGLTNSLFGKQDCISADLFMKRKDSAKFSTYMKEHLADVKYNPGKHSM